jgi:hypothetical protein
MNEGEAFKAVVAQAKHALSNAEGAALPA